MVDSSKDLEKTAGSDKSSVVNLSVVQPSRQAPYFSVEKLTYLLHRISRLLNWTPKVVPPPPGSLDDAKLIPEATAGWFSLLTFSWITALLSLGYARPLEATDLYKLQDERSAAVIGKKIVDSFERRRRIAAEYNTRLEKGEISPGLKGLWWSLRGIRAEREKHWREVSGKKKASLALAMNDSVFWVFWTGGLCRLISDTATITSPLLVKVSFFILFNIC
jgi:hypothetical protein